MTGLLLAIVTCSGSAAVGATDRVSASGEAAGTYRREGHVITEAQWAAPILWWGLVTIGGWASCGVWAGRNGRRGIFALACGRPLFVLGLTYTVWLLGLLGLADFCQRTVWLCAAAWAGVGVTIWGVRRRGLADLVRGHWRQIVVFEAACLAAFAAMVLCRAWHPSLEGGEKMMDLAHINVMLRCQHFPPPQPWMGLLPMNYYYLGYLMVACMIKLTGVETMVAYNVVLATWYGLMFGAAWAAGWWMSRRAVGGAIAAVLFAVVGNLQALRLVWGPALKGLWGSSPWVASAASAPALDWGFFWNLTRLSWDQNMFHEFPLWTQMFGDVHPHQLSMPIYLVALAWLWDAFRGRVSLRRWRGSSLWALLFGGWIIGTLAVINTWDWLTFVVLVWLTLLGRVIWLRIRVGVMSGPSVACATSGPASRLVSEWIGPAQVLTFLSLLASLPFWLTLQPGPNAGLHRSTQWPLSVVHMTVIFGVPTGLLVLWALARRVRGIWPILGVVAATVVVGCVIRYPHTGGLAAGVGAAAAFLLVAGCRGRPAGRRRAWAWWLAACAGLILATCEVVSIVDRANTVFKMHLPCWGLLGVAVAALWSRRPLAGLSFRSRTVVACLGTLLVAGGLYTTVTAGIAWCRAPRGPVPTLDGGAWFRQFRLNEMLAAEWLNRNVPGVPVLLEAAGGAYSPATRMCQVTGLPVVAGWDWHLYQKGYEHDQISRRLGDVAEIYRTDDRRKAAKLLDRYGVAYVFVGGLERQTYGAGVSKKFEGWLPVAYRHGDVVIYRAWPRNLSMESESPGGK